MAAALTKALGREVRYNAVSPEVYRTFGFPGADDRINLLMAAAAWNLKQWLLVIFWLFFPWRKLQIYRIP